MGPSEYRAELGQRQEATSHFRQRRCLLKGCEQPFRPRRPQTRYCSEACRVEAEHWRRWRSSRTYRASAAGQQRRREQARRYRERRREAARQAESGASVSAVGVAQEAVQLEGPSRCEGQRPAGEMEDSVLQPCQRPGCYVLFVLRWHVPQQRYCSCPCRHALRRVLDREVHWRRRRERQRLRRCGRPPPR